MTQATCEMCGWNGFDEPQKCDDFSVIYTDHNSYNKPVKETTNFHLCPAHAEWFNSFLGDIIG